MIITRSNKCMHRELTQDLPRCWQAAGATHLLCMYRCPRMCYTAAIARWRIPETPTYVLERWTLTAMIAGADWSTARGLQLQIECTVHRSHGVSSAAYLQAHLLCGACQLGLPCLGSPHKGGLVLGLACVSLPVTDGLIQRPQSGLNLRELHNLSYHVAAFPAAPPV